MRAAGPSDEEGLRALTTQSELFFRTYLHATLPLHAGLVEAMCRGPRVPLQLATVLEDIGQGYLRLATELNQELKRRNELKDEPSEEDADETRFRMHADRIVACAGEIALHDGAIVDARRAFENFLPVCDAMNTALLLEAAQERGIVSLIR